jgi:PAS domain S-box-containing protein
MNPERNSAKPAPTTANPDPGLPHESTAFLLHPAAWLVLAVSLAATIGGWFMSRMHVEMVARNQFDDETSRITASLTERMLMYQDVLHGAQGLFAASASVGRGEWRAYVESASIEKRFPGIEALGFVANVPREDLNEFLKTTRADNATGFALKNAGAEDELLILKFIEPEQRHHGLLGWDLASVPGILPVAERARDSGLAVISGKMRLAEGSNTLPGFVMLLPVYQHGASTDTVEDRQAGIEGWIYASFSVDHLMRGILESKSLAVDLELFDTLQPGPDNMMFSEDLDWPAANPNYHSHFSDSVPIRIAGHAWTLHFRTNPAFDAALPQSYSMIVAGGGTLVSLLLFGIVWSISRTRETALAIASQMTAALRETNAKLEHERFLLRTLMDNLPDRIYFKDAQSRFLRNSQAHLNRFGLQHPSEAVGKSDFDFFSGEHAREAYEDEQQLMRTGRSLTKEERETWPDGSVTWALSTKMPLRDEKGQIIGTFGISHDITDRKRAEEALRHAKEAAEEANLTKSQFLANVSHELRTPLNSVIGFANILLKNKTQNMSTADLNFLERIQVNGRHLLALINDMLDLSKIEAHKVELQLAPVALDVLVKETVSQQEALIGERPITFFAEVPQTVAPIETDGEKLRQVIINLIGNALKFTERGSVTVRVVTHPANHRPLRIEVADTGIGIPKDKLAMIFNAFQQADASTARRFGGTGLGLTISQALCGLMGFHIEVASELGCGSTFSIVLSSLGADGSLFAPDGSGRQLHLDLKHAQSPQQAA